MYSNNRKHIANIFQIFDKIFYLQILSSFMLSISAIVMSYIQNPQPMTPPWASGNN